MIGPSKRGAIVRHRWRDALIAVLVGLAVSASYAHSADKAPPQTMPPTATPTGFDLEFGGQILSDYVYRGFSITDRGPTVQGSARAVFHGYYVGMTATGIDVPFRAPAVLDFHAGARHPFGPILFDSRVNYYYFPDSFIPTTNIPGKFDYWEIQTRPLWTVNESLLLILHAGYTPNFVNLGASDTWLSGTAVVKGPFQPLPGWGAYLSAELGHQWMGTTDANVNLPDYFAWNVGSGLVYGPHSFDLRYHDSSMTKEECWIMTGDLGAAPGGAPSPANPFGLRSNWCGAALIGKISVDTSLSKLGLLKPSR